MNQRADGHAQQNVREHLFEGGNHLIPGIEQAFLLRQRRRLDVHRAGIADEGFHLLFHVQALNQRAAGDGDDQAQYHISDGNLCAEYAHEQHEAAQIHHGRRNQKGKRYAQRQPRTGKTDEQRDRRTGAKRRDRAQQRRHAVGPQSVKASHDLLAALRREIALYVRNQEDQQAQQHGDLEHVIQEKLHAAANTGLRIQSGGGQKLIDQCIEPPHAQHLILNKLPHAHFMSSLLSCAQLHTRPSINWRKAVSVSQFSE